MPGVASREFRVGYAETDQMGIVHHANYLVWCEDARTHYMRQAGILYRDLEEQGLLLAVVEVSVRYRLPAKYDDLLRIDCWVRESGTRRVIFGYAVYRVDDARCLATAIDSQQ